MVQSGDQDFFTARELAEIASVRGLLGFPATERGVQKFADREGWNELPERMARWRLDPAGGRPAMEYHRSLLPEMLQAIIQAMAIKARNTALISAEQDADRRRMAALRATALSARARSVMEARAEVLSAIEGYAISQGQSRAWGIARFLEAQDQWAARQESEARREAGQFLTDREMRDLARPLLLTSDAGLQLSPAKIAAANDRRKAGKVSRRTIYDWFKVRDEQGVVALAPAATKEAAPIPAGFADFLRHYAVGSKPTITDAHRDYLAAATRRPGPQPMTLSLDQVEYILRVRLNNIERNVGREGLLTLRKRLAYVTRTTDDMWPTTVYTADGKTFDAEVADPVSGRPMRPEITSVLDVATRKCVGYAVSRKENVIAVTEALRRSCSGHGICAIFYTDRGAGYKNKTFDADAGGLMARLGITKAHALPYNSQAKGIIERFNAVWNALAKRLPTYIGEDMDKEAGQRVHKATRTDIRVFGRSAILPSWDAFISAVETTIAEYNDRPHRGLPRFTDPETGQQRHMSPNEAWAAHVAAGFEPVTIDPAEVDDLFRPYEVRTCRRAQVEWNKNQYFHIDLEAWHERRVMVGYDLDQADKVWVREYDEESGQPGRLIAVATFAGNKERYFPLTAQRAAEENRARGQLRRLGKKVEAVHEQLRSPLIEATPLSVMPQIVMPDPAPRSMREPEPVAASGTGAITSDAELARLCIADPTQLTAGRAQILREVLSRRSGRELLRISGVDLDELSDLLRSAA